MHTAPDSPASTSRSTGTRVAGVGPRKRWARPRPPNYLHDAGMWWGNWVPVATTGWGALALILPLLATHLLLWVTGPQTSPQTGPQTTEPRRDDDPSGDDLVERSRSCVPPQPTRRILAERGGE